MCREGILFDFGIATSDLEHLLGLIYRPGMNDRTCPNPILGIETSCDETAAAIVDGWAPPGARILANIVLSQLDDHRPYGGVVPEVAARAHIEHLDRLIREALDAAQLKVSDLGGVAATAGPGLIGGVMVGLMTGKAIALARNIPFSAVNHLEAHALTARLTDDVEFPYLLLLVSGGHCQLLLALGVGQYRRLGSTIDDAVGEAFDKVAKMLGLGYPGGPLVERAAAQGDSKRFALPRPMIGRDDCLFSFSGLKTAVRRLIDLNVPLDPQVVADIAASFQAAVGDVMVDRVAKAIPMLLSEQPQMPTLVVAGGVAANRFLRARLEQYCHQQGVVFLAPPGQLCTDNAAMVAWAGFERMRCGLIDGLDRPARPRWPLDEQAEKLGFAGVKA